MLSGIGSTGPDRQYDRLTFRPTAPGGPMARCLRRRARLGSHHIALRPGHKGRVLMLPNTTPVQLLRRVRVQLTAAAIALALAASLAACDTGADDGSVPTINLYYAPEQSLQRVIDDCNTQSGRSLPHRVPGAAARRRRPAGADGPAARRERPGHGTCSAWTSRGPRSLPALSGSWNGPAITECKPSAELSPARWSRLATTVSYTPHPRTPTSSCCGTAPTW